MPATAPQSATRRMARRLESMTGVGAPAIIMIVLGVILYVCAIFIDAVAIYHEDYNAWPSSVRGWFCFRQSFIHAWSLLFEQRVLWPQDRMQFAWASLVNLAFVTSVSLLPLSLFRRTFCRISALQMSVAALSVLVSGAIRFFDHSILGPRVDIHTGAILWALGISVLTVGLWVVFMDLHPNRVEARRMDRLSRHGV